MPEKSRTLTALPSRSSRLTQAQQLALGIAEVALEKKAAGIEIIDVDGKVDYADYLVLMSGRSDRQVSALADNIEEEIRRRGRKCIAKEGLPGGAWVLMDYGDVVVHIFHQEARAYYNLDALWLDARRIDVPAQSA
ncbi:MAG: ribosome silencing factor [Polyangiales bacterium]